jgi:hypothetical protein
LSFLSLSNIIFSSGIIIVAFALMLYLTTSNFRNSVARSFSALLAFIAIVYVGDVLLQRVETFAIATIWLKFKWIGIAFVPAEYLHFSDAVLRSTNAFSPRRRLATILGYVASSIFLFLVVLTDLVARGGFFVKYVAAQFGAGPMFPLFAIFFFTLTAWGWYNLRKARRRCLTATTRRRMDYLSAAFIAPALGVFPYLITASFLRDAQTPPSEIVLMFLLAGTLIAKIGVGVMITVMAYTVAYQGALSPDRIIKHNLVHYLLRGPLVATMVVGLMLSASAVPEWLGLTRETILFATVIIAIVVLELVINLAKPFLDKIIFWSDRHELERIQEIDKRLLTTSDLRQLLENILGATCDLLRVQNGFIIAPEGDAWRITAVVGARERMRAFLDATNLDELVVKQNGGGFIAREGFWLWRLRAKSGEGVRGLMGVAARAPEPNLTVHEQTFIAALAEQAELALEDRQLQQGVFSVLEEITSEIEFLQRARSKPRFVGALETERIEEEVMPASPAFHRAVKDALDHYWGGPKLSENPLLRLRIVQAALPEFEGNPSRALRARIAQAIETLKPDGKRSLTAPEWLLYNILELKVMQGKKVREIAYQLALSESDLYRKQRIAIQEIAKTLATMEEQSAPKSEAPEENSTQ